MNKTEQELDDFTSRTETASTENVDADIRKRCCKCKLEKQLNQFSPDKTRRHGVSSKCKECHREYNGKYKPYKDNWYRTVGKFRGYKVNKVRRNKYLNELYKKDPLPWICRSLVMRTLNGRLKTKRSNELLGYSRDELKSHLECQFVDGMTWKNWGKWHIDHIKPISTFPRDAAISEINALTNLRPLWAKDNLRRRFVEI